jgi:hypothetical protein
VLRICRSSSPGHPTWDTTRVRQLNQQLHFEMCGSRCIAFSLKLVLPVRARQEIDVQ